MQPELIIWDWNGTILDDVNVCFEIANIMLSERGLNKLQDLDAYRSVFGFPIKEYYRRMGYTYETESYETAADEFVQLYLKLVPQCSLRTGIINTLETFLKAGIPQVLLSATKESQLLEQVRSYEGIEPFFNRILGLNDHYAVSKTSLASDFMANARIRPENVIFIGDTDHDYEVAHAAGSPAVLVTGGHQSKEKLQKTGAFAIADSLEELEKIILCD